jgi:hypothetical protein
MKCEREGTDLAGDTRQSRFANALGTTRSACAQVSRQCSGSLVPRKFPAPRLSILLPNISDINLDNIAVLN